MRRALPSGKHAFGTVLVLESDPVMEGLWERDLDFVALGDARAIEIFLDAVMAYATDAHSYLLADGYESTLSAPDAHLSAAIDALLDELDDLAQSSSAWPVLLSALSALGWEPRAQRSALDWRPSRQPRR